jgi:hypothetical protein
MVVEKHAAEGMARPHPGESVTPLPREQLLERLGFARAESEQVMRAIDAESENQRNLLYRLAQAQLTLNEVLTEILRRLPAQ